MFCVKCGRESETIDGLCAECFLDGKEVIALPQHIDLERCTNCEEFHVNGAWKAKDLQDAVEDVAADGLMAIPEATVLDVGTGMEELDRRNFLVTVEAVSDVGGITVTETRSTTVRIKNTVCKRCSRQLGDYYEATLQIRTSKKELDDITRDEVVRRIRDEVETMASSNRHLFITKVTEVAGGIDMLMSSISMSRTIARGIADSYGGEFKESSKLVGKTSDGADMYRLTHLVRLPEYQVGDIVGFDGVPHKLTWIGKNGVKLTRLADFREVSAKHGDSKTLRVLAERDGLNEAVVVSVSDGEVQVLHPSNYSTVDLKVPAGAEIGETVTVVAVDDVLYYVP